jgi:hypothetical protein
MAAVFDSTTPSTNPLTAPNFISGPGYFVRSAL